MAIQSCPTAIVRAPADTVWRLLTTPRGMQRWTGVRVLQGPDRPLAADDQLVLGGLFGSMRMIIRVVEVEPPRRLALDTRFPFGIVSHEVMVISPISNSECRTTYN